MHLESLLYFDLKCLFGRTSKLNILDITLSIESDYAHFLLIYFYRCVTMDMLYVYIPTIA